MNSRKKKKITVAVLLTALALGGVLLAGCSLSRRAEVEPGEYVVLNDGATPNRAAAQEIQGVAIDRDKRLIVLTRVDGSEIVTSFVARDRTKWPAGCPSNVHSTRMEVLEIAEDPLTIGATTFSHPVLVRDCPPDPMRLVLREDGAIGGGGSACPHPVPCIYFAPRSPDSPSSLLLPRSPKGYELYSWPRYKEWRFTLITGTNRLKRYQEIVSPESTITETDWVKLSVQGTENLKAVLQRLPEGENVTWIGDGWLERVGAPKGNIHLPGQGVLKEIDGYCSRLGIQLQIAY
jgi:hypothetical protein